MVVMVKRRAKRVEGAGSGNVSHLWSGGRLTGCCPADGGTSARLAAKIQPDRKVVGAFSESRQRPDHGPFEHVNNLPRPSRRTHFRFSAWRAGQCPHRGHVEPLQMADHGREECREQSERGLPPEVCLDTEMMSPHTGPRTPTPHRRPCPSPDSLALPEDGWGSSDRNSILVPNHANLAAR